jgi:hypothetical protein
MNNFISAMNTYTPEAKAILLKRIRERLSDKSKREIELITNELMSNREFKKLLGYYE